MSMLATIQTQPATVDTLHQTAMWFFWTGGVAITTVVSIGALLGLLTMTMVAAPGLTSRCAGALRQHGFLSFLAGAGMIGVFVVLGKVAERVPAVGLAAICGFGALLVFGLAATAEDIGRRLAWVCGREGSRVSHLITGWLIFAAAICVPIVGWFIVLPYGALSGVGSILVAPFTRSDGVAASRKPVDMEMR